MLASHTEAVQEVVGIWIFFNGSVPCCSTFWPCGFEWVARDQSVGWTVCVGGTWTGSHTAQIRLHTTPALCTWLSLKEHTMHMQSSSQICKFGSLEEATWFPCCQIFSFPLSQVFSTLGSVTYKGNQKFAGEEGWRRMNNLTILEDT